MLPGEISCQVAKIFLCYSPIQSSSTMPHVNKGNYIEISILLAASSLAF